MKNLIVYGAGPLAVRDIQKSLAKQGRTISCFADRDEKKWNKPADHSSCIVYSLKEAVKRYPNYSILINVRPSIKLHVQEEILSSKLVSADRIENYEPCEEYVGCD